MQYAWLIWSLMLLVIWAVVYFSLRSKESRKEMLIVSLWTSLLGLTEPFFVPEYWNPPSLFNLALRTGFDIESLLFAFGVGGLAVVIYEGIFPVKHERVSTEEKRRPRHKYHLLALLSAREGGAEAWLPEVQEEGALPGGVRDCRAGPPV